MSAPIELRPWRAFAVMKEERHFRRAAERLALSQPALTRQVTDLQERLDVVLFDRGPRGVEPTQAACAIEGDARAARCGGGPRTIGPGGGGRERGVRGAGIGVHHGLRFAISAMLPQGGGTVVNLSSGSATSALEGWSHYCATKAAVRSLTRIADPEYRDRGIRVIGLSPGTVATEMQARIRRLGLNPVSELDPLAHIPPASVHDGA